MLDASLREQAQYALEDNDMLPDSLLTDSNVTNSILPASLGTITSMSDRRKSLDTENPTFRILDVIQHSPTLPDTSQQHTVVDNIQRSPTLPDTSPKNPNQLLHVGVNPSQQHICISYCRHAKVTGSTLILI